MIEKVILNYLKENLEVEVYMEVPKRGTSNFIVIEKLGGSMNDRLFHSSFAIQSYGKTLLDAALLNDKVINAMIDINSLNEVSRCNLNSNYNFTDTSTKQYRYQAVFDLIHY